MIQRHVRRALEQVGLSPADLPQDVLDGVARYLDSGEADTDDDVNAGEALQRVRDGGGAAPRGPRLRQGTRAERADNELVAATRRRARGY